MEQIVGELLSRGFAWIRRSLGSADAAFEEARRLIEQCCAAKGLPALEVIGDFVLPPADGCESRDFQTLHFDFGLPLVPTDAQDVARYTALHIPEDWHDVYAVTRLVPLAALLRQRAWPSQGELVERLARYGATHGSWADADGYVEGSLARIIEAAGGGQPALPSVKVDPDFLCGMEFDSLAGELRFFEQHGLRIEATQLEVRLEPGELLIFDNLAVAHGRRGSRQPGELRQRVFGHRGLDIARQRELRDHVLGWFQAPQLEAGCGRRRIPAGL